MTRFQFRLESVLAWRKAQLEAEEFRLRAMLGEGAAVEREIAELEAARAAAERNVRAAEWVAAGDLWALAGYREAARLRAAALARRKEQCEAEARAQRERIAAAQRRCRLLERLKERRLAEWTYENRRELENFASDAYLARWKAR